MTGDSVTIAAVPERRTASGPLPRHVRVVVIGALGGRGPAVPGSRGQGTFATSVPGGNAFSGSMLGLRLSFRTPTSNGAVSGAMVVDGCTIVRESGDGSANVLRSEVQNTAISTATATVPAQGGTMTYVFSSARIVGSRYYNIQRGDGSFAAIEELELIFTQVTITEPGGRTGTYQAAQP